MYGRMNDEEELMNGEASKCMDEWLRMNDAVM